jgi:penicillin-binding protein 1A
MALKKNGKKKKGFRWWRFILKAFATGFLVFLFFFITVYFGFTGKMPDIEELSSINTLLASEVFSADGKLLGRYYIENRSRITYREIPPHLIHALVATEDARFFKHQGVDELALLRVFFKNLLFQDRSAGGGSTISQQIAKALYPRKNMGVLTLPVHKIREAIIAYRLEKIYTKEEILTLYLNTVPFGENIFGIEVAAERFFSKSVSDLTVPEAAVLIGILKANSLFNPRLHPEQSVKRRNIVIDQMVRHKFIAKAEGEKFKSEPLGLNYRLITYNQGPAPGLLEYLKDELTDWCLNHQKENGEKYNLYTDGLKIYTTVDYEMQKFARSAVNEHMKSLQSKFDEHWKNKPPWGSDGSVVARAVRRTDRYKKAISQGKKHDEIMKSFSVPAEATLFTWDGLRQEPCTPLDSVKHYLKMLNTGFVVMDHSSGAIRAWIGNIDFRFFKLNYCTVSRQVGSTFKPVVYLAALEYGLSPFDYYSAESKVYEVYDNWTPENASDSYSGWYTMKEGLSHSINTVTVDIIMQSGITNTVKTARKLGIRSELPAYPSLALGVASIPLLEMVSAYATIANLGKPVKPHAILRIENSGGELLEEFSVAREDKTDLDPENCRIITDMLQAAVNSGTGTKIRSVFHVPGDFAGKTGTTQDFADGWFIGYSPKLAAGCWVGADDPSIHFRNMTFGQGAYMALPVVGRFFQLLYDSPKYSAWKNDRFEAPDSVILEKINRLPGHIEELKQERDFNFLELFKKKDARVEQREKNEKPGLKQDEKKRSSDREPAWEKIKKIFRKE